MSARQQQKNRKRELAFQTKILESYKLAGGTGDKWNNEWLTGRPDLILSLPEIGGHLMEVKHRPTWERAIKNPMTPKQREVAARFMDADCLVVLGIVRGGSPTVITSQLALFNPLHDILYPDNASWYGWRGKNKFDVKSMMMEYVG